VVIGAEDEDRLGDVADVTFGRGMVGIESDPGSAKLGGRGDEFGRRDRGVGRGKLNEVVYRSILDEGS